MRNDFVELVITCPYCGCDHFVEVSERDWECYESGALAEVCFPYLSTTEREQIISHVCSSCQTKIFG